MAPSNTYIVALDCGSTSFKAAIFDQHCHRLSEGSIAVPYTIQDSERVEMDAEAIWNCTLTLLRKIGVKAGIPPNQWTTIVITSQAQTFTIVDDAKHPQFPLLSWLDKRAIVEATELASHFGVSFHNHCTVPSPLPQLQVAKLLWIRHHHPKIFTPDIKIVSLPGFLTLRFSALNLTDHNLAAMSGLYSLQQRGWWKEVLNFCDLTKSQLPMLIEMGRPIPSQASCHELAPPSQKTSWTLALAGNDQTAGAYANRSHKGEFIVTLGTALVVYRYAGQEPGPYHPFGFWGPYPGGGFYELATRNEGCLALDWARNHLMPGADVKTFIQHAESVSSTELNNDTSLNVILFDPTRIQTENAWVGTGNLEQKTRAVLEGIGFSLRQLIFEDLQADTEFSSLCIIGGGSQSSFWLQLLANILNRPVRRGDGDSLLGAAMMVFSQEKLPIASATDYLSPEPQSVALEDQRFNLWKKTFRAIAAEK